MNYPFVLFFVSVLALWGASITGSYFRRRKAALEEHEREELGIVLSATLTLLALIIGFTFSMAVARYDQRKTHEAQEANAIRTEYFRASLLPPADIGIAQSLLKAYLAQRSLFYTTGDAQQLKRIHASTLALQKRLWNTVRKAAVARPNSVNALIVGGTTDVLDSQGYTQAAFWNRIPLSAWGLMAVIAICCNFLIGYRSSSGKNQARYILLPVIVSVALFLIADLDTPRRGLIEVTPHNLTSLYQSL